MPAQTYDFSVNLEEIRSRLVWRLSLLLTGLGIVVTWYVLVRRDLPFGVACIPLSFVVLNRIVQLMLNKNPALGRYVFVWGMAAHLLAALLVSSNPLLPYGAVLLILISAMVITNGGLISTALFVAATAGLNLLGVRSYPLFQLTAVLVAVAGSSWIIAYTLFAVVHWYSATQLRSRQLLEITREHRAELSQALKSLQLAYEVQKHIQFELVWARKHAEDARRLKEQFAANISHELWTPLNLILGFSEVMYLSPEVYGELNWPPGLRRDVYQIYRNSQHLLGLVGDILDLSRFEMTEFNINPQPTDLAPFLAETLEIVKHAEPGRDLHWEFAVPDDLPTVEIDCTRIRQVILNLLNNAHRFCETGVIELAAQQQGQEVVISVRDTGPGISADKLPYLFDEFYQVNPSLTRSRNGAGLGLAISKRFVEVHRGRIWVESEEGVGSCFYFSLPVMERFYSVRHAQGTERAVSAEAARRCVLVLGAEGGTVPLLERSLKDCEVVPVHDERDLPDLILMRHPTMIILNTHSEPPPATSQTLVETGVPVVECDLPASAAIPEALGIQAYVTQPVNARQLVEEIDRIGDVRRILVAFSDRSSALLVERMLQASARSFAVRRSYDYAAGVAALGEQPPDLVILDTVTPDTDSLRLLEYMRAQPDFEALPAMVLTKNLWVREPQRANRFVVQQREGLSPSEILKFLDTVVTGLSPRYYSALVANLEAHVGAEMPLGSG